jgi:hypothetical protein
MNKEQLNQNQEPTNEQRGSQKIAKSPKVKA